MTEPTRPAGADGQWWQGSDGQWHQTAPEPAAPTGGDPAGPDRSGHGPGRPASGPAARPPSQTGVPVSAGEEQGWGVAMHLGGVFLSWLVPLVLWLVFRQRSRMLDDHGKEALNFQITLFIAYLVGAATTIILIGFLILFLAWVLSVVFSILAAVAAYNRRPFRYPLTLRFIK